MFSKVAERIDVRTNHEISSSSHSYSSVSALTICPPANHATPKHGADDRRNLYVLGLPFALSKYDSSLYSRPPTDGLQE